MRFADRTAAGQELGHALADLKGRDDLLVLGIPRGGVVVASEVARALSAPLDIYLTHKLGAPENPELAIGAVAEDGLVVLDQNLDLLWIPSGYVKAEAERQRQELARRAQLYRRDRPPPDVKNHTVVVIDDGLATGSTMLATVQALAVLSPASLIAAIPVAPLEAIQRLSPRVNRIECLACPELFWAVGAFYAEFGQVSDDEVVELLSNS